MDSEQSLQHFLRLLDAWAVGDALLIRRALSFRHEDGWKIAHVQNVIFNDLFDEMPADHFSNFSIKTNSIFSQKESIFPHNYDSIVDNITNNPGVVQLHTTFCSLTPGLETSPNFYFNPYGHRDIHRRQRWPCLMISAANGEYPDASCHRYTLDLELLSCELPFDGIDDLLMELGFFQNVIDHGQRSNIEWVITPPAAVSTETKFDNNKLLIYIVANHSVKNNDLLLGVRFSMKEQPISRICIKGSDFRWEEQERVKIGQKEIPAEGVGLANIFLSYHGEFLERHTIRNNAGGFNNKLRVNDIFDENKIIGENLLNQNDNYFEDLVSNALEILGFSVLKYGATIPDAPDILAYSGQGHVLVIECTTGSISKDDKLIKLNRRTNRIKDMNNSEGLGFSLIQPVMITKFSREETKFHWEQARAFGISIICREDLKWLVDQLDSSLSPEQLIEAVVRRIPKNPNELGSHLF